MTRKKYLLKNIGILTVSNFATKILSFFLVPLYTDILSTSEYGIYDIVSTTVGLLFPILTANIADAVMRFSLDEDCSKEDIGKLGIVYILRSNFVFFLLMLFISLLGISEIVKQYALLILLYYFTSSIMSFMIQYAKGCERIKDMGIAGVISTAFSIVFNLLFLLVFNLGLVGFFLASILSATITIVFYSVRLNVFCTLKKGKKNKILEKEMLSYCIPLIATTLSWWVNSSSDRYIVTFFCGFAANGLLSIAYKLPSIMEMLLNIFTQAWQISAVKEYGGEETSVFYGKTFLTINVLMCATCAWIIFLNRPLATLLFSKDFYNAWKFVPFLLISSVINCASGVLGPILVASKNSKALMSSAIVGAGINILLNYILVKTIGIQGVTIATAISSYVIYVIRKKAVGIEIKIDKYYIVGLTWILLCCQAMLEINSAKWYTELGVMLGMLFLNIGTLKNVVNSIKLSKS